MATTNKDFVVTGGVKVATGVTYPDGTFQNSAYSATIDGGNPSSQYGNTIDGGSPSTNF